MVKRNAIVRPQVAERRSEMYSSGGPVNNISMWSCIMLTSSTVGMLCRVSIARRLANIIKTDRKGSRVDRICDVTTVP